MRVKIAALVMAVIAISATLGASAYTTGTVTRSASVDVVSDDAGLIALSDGTSGGIVSQGTDGALNINFAQGSAGGVNPSATYELGNPTDPTNQTAFNVSNLDSTSHSLTVEYTNVESAVKGDGTTNIQFQFYNSTGSQVATISEESSSATINSVGSGETLYVVVVVDTTGLTSSESLTGDLTVSA